MNKITVFTNGRARQISESASLAELIDLLDLSPSSILVEKNGEVVLRGEISSVKLEHGDRLEFIRVVAGG